MKAKCIELDVSFLTRGKIYDVIQSPTFPESYLVENDAGMKIEYWKSRFEIVDPIKTKTAEIEETEARLAVLKKELADLQAPKVGQKYLHSSGNKYILAQIEGKFCLICYSIKDGNEAYIGRGYSGLKDKTGDVFLGLGKAFTLIEE